MSRDLDRRVHEIFTSRSGLFAYRVVRRLIRLVLFPYFRVRTTGADHLNTSGPLVIAPVHRSNLDATLIGAVGHRRVRALSKESLFANRVFAWLIAALGAYPVRRGTADREALRTSRHLLDDGQALLVFPEGTRQRGETVSELFDGCAYLAAKTGARVVPVGIAGTEAALPPGVRRPRRTRVAIVVGEPLPAPGTASMRARREFSAQLQERLQALFDVARAEAGS